MAIDVLNTGTAAGSGDGESLRSAMTKVNSNFGAAENAASKIVQASSADTTSDKVMLTDHAWRGAQLGDYFTYGGTANAITLTSASLRAGGTLIKGMKFRFEATAANTGATTIAVDGGSAITCVTPTGAALPAGFIRTDVFTECEYDGANFVVSRKIESGSNANGLWTRWEDGRQVVNHEVTVGAANVAKGSIFSSASASVWTYPVPFINNQHSVSGSIPDVGGWVNATLGNGTTTANIILWKAQSSGDTEQCYISATGKWY